ncbi:rRNA maturation RNase YbeY [Saccharicrinis sp. FJH54]|uniref:rRNA maturation RNase YbeY n=1 Tax=Saccharicrinis sp. FJH54 TaxID=3344665 RepID=UPI0035D3E8B8
MEICFFAEDIDMPDFDQDKISDWIIRTIDDRALSTWNISVIFCSDAYLLNINRQYLNHDYYTDVITFDYSENKRVSGDIFISVDMIRFNAEKFARNEKNELFRVIIHGVLHLCGYKDKSPEDKKEMTKQENLALSNLSF